MDTEAAIGQHRRCGADDRAPGRRRGVVGEQPAPAEHRADRDDAAHDDRVAAQHLGAGLLPERHAGHQRLHEHHRQQHQQRHEQDRPLADADRGVALALDQHHLRGAIDQHLAAAGQRGVARIVVGELGGQLRRRGQVVALELEVEQRGAHAGQAAQR